MSYYVYNNGELYHFGVKGMKWGVKRYYNKDGSLTQKGKQHKKDLQYRLKSAKKEVNDAYEKIDKANSAIDRYSKYSKKAKTNKAFRRSEQWRNIEDAYKDAISSRKSNKRELDKENALWKKDKISKAISKLEGSEFKRKVSAISPKTKHYGAIAAGMTLGIVGSIALSTFMKTTSVNKNTEVFTAGVISQDHPRYPSPGDIGYNTYNIPPYKR